MFFISKLRNLLKSKTKDESGVLTVEALLVFPMLVWTITGAFTYFDGFRQSASNLKAAYTVGDLISRETGTITDTYITSLHSLLVAMVNNRSQMNLRVSLVVFDEEDDRHYVRWSTARGYDSIWTDDNIDRMRDNLPPMPNQDTLIIVETANAYIPVFDSIYGVDFLKGDHVFENFVFTRPRFTNEVAANVSGVVEIEENPDGSGEIGEIEDPGTGDSGASAESATN
ncbi:hypothetical protein [Ruegeria faecimaris]|uniref:Flp pilus assembly protein TadG n=2 Tax=Ruegeria faecimaris TaxID=686389 RepID=A0A521BPW0_9RHOB|nr:hypothetical protein [Ruegeria faecimaris]SMO49163.1 hypothetical protein SAMN06265380_1011042 [Ruegeria faecimaris]